MPPRVARSSVAAAKPRSARKKNQKRSLDAFAIAEKEVGDRPKIRQHRLGEAEDDNPRRKRQRLDEDDEDDEDDPRPSHFQKKPAKGRFDELDISEGSDSDGNTWHMGHVDEDDDSDIDSDEAFDESDEERFADFTFRGSSSGKGKKKAKSKPAKSVDEDGDVDLEEDEEESEDDDDESLGSDAVDLAQMLDDYEEEQNEERSNGKKARKQQEESDASEEDTDEDESEASDFQMSDGEEDDRDPGKISQLQDFITSISQDAGAKSKKQRVDDVHEASAPSEFGVGASQKLDIGDLLAGTNDPDAKKIIKMLKDSKSSKRQGIPGKLDAPLPKRQQDKLDRIAANEKAKETLERWVDTVKQNRRAEHISFPIRDPDAQEPMGSKSLLPITTAKPANDLESTIQSIMEESGLATGKKSEDQIQEFEELQTNKMPIEEVMARRAELRKARDLLFREEVRAKRVKKIKSKSWRRVHRKERERLEEQERQALAEAGVELSDTERERNDRRRAEERMGTKHRESKWAKSLKATGRAAWDEDARAGLSEMARRNEELIHRIKGKDIHDEDDNATEMSSEGDDDDDDSDAGEVRRLRRQLDRVDGDDPAETSGLSKLASMKFMQRAEAARKAQNDEDIERIRRELAEEDGEEAEDDDDQPKSIGRRTFGPTSDKKAQPAQKPVRSEFEEQLGSDDEEDEVNIVLDGDKSSASQKKQSKAKAGDRKKKTTVANLPSEEPEDNPWAVALTTGNKSKSKSRQATSSSLAPTLDVSESKPEKAKHPKKATETAAPPDADGWTTVTSRNEEASGDGSDQEPENPFVLRKESLVEKAFAGDEVADAFEAEKRAIEEDEGDKVVDNTLPGWGNWVGDGVSKRDKKRNTGRFLTTQKGVKKENRKDAKLKNVVINEKRVKKNSKYLASSLPFPHQSKQVYESTLRRPLGPEFNTKEVYQDSTKPRVMVKPGVVIKPLAKPLV